MKVIMSTVMFKTGVSTFINTGNTNRKTEDNERTALKRGEATWVCINKGDLS